MVESLGVSTVPRVFNLVGPQTSASICSSNGNRKLHPVRWSLFSFTPAILPTPFMDRAIGKCGHLSRILSRILTSQILSALVYFIYTSIVGLFYLHLIRRGKSASIWNIPTELPLGPMAEIA
uniref:Uncharacterized protein n=1 Tax=Pipistrellus kuhlii TaxID=59472 RepID=A0A7J8A7R0_PIPKU|nr:hypothetical protein mPipKuh1_008963 [Pipistrellus kuhlii]